MDDHITCTPAALQQPPPRIQTTQQLRSIGGALYQAKVLVNALTVESVAEVVRFVWDDLRTPGKRVPTPAQFPSVYGMSRQWYYDHRKLVILPELVGKIKRGEYVDLRKYKGEQHDATPWFPLQPLADLAAGPFVLQPPLRPPSLPSSTISHDTAPALPPAPAFGLVPPVLNTPGHVIPSALPGLPLVVPQRRLMVNRTVEAKPQGMTLTQMRRAIVQKLSTRFGSSASGYKLTRIEYPRNTAYKSNYDMYTSVAESVVFHGAPKEAIESIASNGFDEAKITGCSDDGSATRYAIYLTHDPIIADRRGCSYSLRYMLAVRMLWVTEAGIKHTGCTGGTIAAPVRPRPLFQPTYIIEYEWHDPDIHSPKSVWPDPQYSSKRTLEVGNQQTGDDEILERWVLNHVIITRGALTPTFLRQHFR